LAEERWDSDRGEDANDENHDQKFDEGETLLTLGAMTKTLKHPHCTPV
jgi:hypothetical protein